MKNMYAVSTLKDITEVLEYEGADLKLLTKLIMLTMFNTKQVLISPLRKNQRQNGFMLRHADDGLFDGTPYKGKKFLLIVVHSKNEESCIEELLGDK